MAAAPTTITTNDVATTGPSGKTAGATTKAARKGAAEGGALGTLIAYVMVRTGLETDAVAASLVAGALATVLGVVIAHVQGKRTPTDQAKTEHRTEFRTVVAPGPSAPPEAVIGEDGIPLTGSGSSAIAQAAAVEDAPKHRAE